MARALLVSRRLVLIALLPTGTTNHFSCYAFLRTRRYFCCATTHLQSSAPTTAPIIASSSALTASRQRLRYPLASTFRRTAPTPAPSLRTDNSLNSSAAPRSSHSPPPTRHHARPLRYIFPHASPLRRGQVSALVFYTSRPRPRLAAYPPPFFPLKTNPGSSPPPPRTSSPPSPPTRPSPPRRPPPAGSARASRRPPR